MHQNQRNEQGMLVHVFNPTRDSCISVTHMWSHNALLFFVLLHFHISDILISSNFTAFKIIFHFRTYFGNLLNFFFLNFGSWTHNYRNQGIFAGQELKEIIQHFSPFLDLFHTVCVLRLSSNN